MLPLVAGLIAGSALGLGKHYLSDVPRENADKKLAAEQTRWSPWTRIKPQEIHRANLMGSVMQGGLAGGAFGQLAGGMLGSEAAGPTGIGPVASGSDYASMLAPTGYNAEGYAAGPLADGAAYGERLKKYSPWMG